MKIEYFHLPIIDQDMDMVKIRVDTNNECADLLKLAQHFYGLESRRNGKLKTKFEFVGEKDKFCSCIRILMFPMKIRTESKK